MDAKGFAYLIVLGVGKALYHSIANMTMEDIEYAEEQLSIWKKKLEEEDDEAV